MQRIRPLTEELKTLQVSLASGAARLQECRVELSVLDDRKVGLQDDLSARTDEAAELKVHPPTPVNVLRYALAFVRICFEHAVSHSVIYPGIVDVCIDECVPI